MAEATVSWVRWPYNGTFGPWHVLLTESRDRLTMACPARLQARAGSMPAYERRIGPVIGFEASCADCLRIIGLRQRYRVAPEAA